MSPLSGIIQYLSSWDWLLLLSIMFSRIIPVVAFARIPFLFQSWKIFHYIWTPHFAYLSTCSDHLGYFHTLAVFVFLFGILYGLWDLSFLTSQQWKRWVLTTGLPRNCPHCSCCELLCANTPAFGSLGYIPPKVELPDHWVMFISFVT